MSLLPVLYAEDDAAIAEMTCEVLAEDYAVDWVSDGRVALEYALQRRYAVIVLDRRMPGLDGVEIVRRIRTARITTPILLLTALGAVDDRVDGLDAGANDYLVKPFAFEELLARLRALHRGFTADGQRRMIGEWVFTPDTQAVYSPSGLRIALTETETALLRALAASPEHIFSREELLVSVFAAGTAATDPQSASSVETYVHFLRRKTVPGLIETVRGRGYRLGSPL